MLECRIERTPGTSDHELRITYFDPQDTMVKVNNNFETATEALEVLQSWIVTIHRDYHRRDQALEAAAELNKGNVRST